MVDRRRFLAQVGLVSGAAVNAFAQPNPPATNGTDAVHASMARILVKHFKKIQKDPRHNPFASGEVAAAYRIHCDALQATGVNAAITQAVRSAGTVPVLGAGDVQKHFDSLELLGVTLPSDAKAYVTSQILSAGSNVSSRIFPALQTHTVLKVQRSLHGAILHSKFANDSQLKKATWVEPRLPQSKFVRTNYEPHSGRTLNVAWQLVDDGGDAGWLDSDGEYGDNVEMGMGFDESDGGPDDGYSSSFTASLGIPDAYVTPSGQVVQWCTVGNSIVALGAGSWALGIGYLGTVGAMGTTFIAGIAFTPAGIAILLGLVAALATYYAVMC